MKVYKHNLLTFRARHNAYGCILAGFSFLVLTLLTVKTLAPEINTNAATQKAEQTVGAYKMSMSNDSAATINITPDSSQKVYTTTNNISVLNDCASGATITVKTSGSSNALTRPTVDGDSLRKTIDATSSTSLGNYTWGLALNNSSSYSAVPASGAANGLEVYNESQARTSAYTVPITLGIKTDYNLPSGTYTNDLVYTMTPKSGCLTYSVTWEMDGGTKKSGATYKTSLSWGETVNLSNLTPTKSGYTFAGWTSTPTGSSSGSSNYTGSETAANLNSANAKSVTVTAKWRSNCTENCTEANLSVNESIGYDYTGKVVGVTLKKAGYYKLEAWGAQGGGNGNIDVVKTSGYGGYSYGNIKTNTNEVIYVVVGGSGEMYEGGYNGGGSSYDDTHGGGGGGGATHISTYNCGELKNCSSFKSNVLIVAGGGGGVWLHAGSETRSGGNGGGVNGSDGTNGFGSQKNASCYAGYGGSQSAGGNGGGNSGLFGRGGDADSSSDYAGGGGGGWYGGGGARRTSGVCGGGGGSGYIANTALLSNKSMYQYTYYLNHTEQSCTSSTVTGTRTVCTISTGHAVANAANTGNGYAKITYLGTSI